MAEIKKWKILGLDSGPSQERFDCGHNSGALGVIRGHLRCTDSWRIPTKAITGQQMPDNKTAFPRVDHAGRGIGDQINRPGRGHITSAPGAEPMEASPDKRFISVRQRSRYFYKASGSRDLLYPTNPQGCYPRGFTSAVKQTAFVAWVQGGLISRYEMPINLPPFSITARNYSAS